MIVRKQSKVDSHWDCTWAWMVTQLPTPSRGFFALWQSHLFNKALMLSVASLHARESNMAMRLRMIIEHGDRIVQIGINTYISPVWGWWIPEGLMMMARIQWLLQSRWIQDHDTHHKEGAYLCQWTGMTIYWYMKTLTLGNHLESDGRPWSLEKQVNISANTTAYCLLEFLEKIWIHQ